MKVLMLFLFMVQAGGMTAFAGSGLKVSGKVRSVIPTTIAIETLSGKRLMEASLKGKGEFVMGPVEIRPDVYLLRIGDMSMPYYLENGEVTVNGFFDERDYTKNQLTCKGIDKHLALLKWIPARDQMNLYREFDPAMKSGLTPVMCAAVAFLSKIEEHGPNAEVLAALSAGERKTGLGGWLAHRVDSLKHLAIGAVAPDMPFVNLQGEKVSLKDFRGKYVVVDFWASWCGGCRMEMKTLLPLYEELKGEEVEFISVSMDDKREDWLRMLEEEKLPWVMFWYEKGFSKKWGEPNEIQRAYGFFQIPFIMLLDKKGRIVARHLRGERVREAVVELKSKMGKSKMSKLRVAGIVLYKIK